MNDQELPDSITLGTPSNGGQVKIYVNFKTMTKELIDEKVDAAVDLYERLLIVTNKIKNKWK